MRNDIQEKFSKYHETNPQVFVALRDISLQLLATGSLQSGIDYVHARMRWLGEVEGVYSDGEYLFDNNFRPFYARLLMSTVPALRDFFKLRTSRADLVAA